ncbi:hypothetical protein [Enterococcus faecalis]|uniref:hypothetical protein n=1 Tax=Enterococcus faecalis TaxID=1351 RepID=UPI004041540F
METFYEKLKELLHDENIIPVEWNGGTYEENGETLINANFVYKTKNSPLSKQEYANKEIIEHAEAIAKILREELNPHVRVEVESYGVKVVSDDWFQPIKEEN